MKTVTGRQLTTKRSRSSILIGVFILVVAALIVPLYSAHSGSLGRVMQPELSTAARNGGSQALSRARNSRWPTMSLPLSLVETIETFAADCTTPRTTFNLGETVCAQTNGVTETDRFVNWCDNCATIDYGGAGVTDITTSGTQNFLYTPSAPGLWKATIADPSDSSIIPVDFTVLENEAIISYASDCTTPKTLFNLGETVCIKIVGSPVGVGVRRIAIANAANYIVIEASVNADGQTLSFPIPGTATTQLTPETLVDNRGVWRGLSIASGDGYLRAESSFTVRDTTQLVANLSIGDASRFAVGDVTGFGVFVANKGPDAATNVEVTDSVPLGTTYEGVSQESGPIFTCVGPSVGATSGTITCSIPTLASGAVAEFNFQYNTAGLTAGTVVSHAPEVESSTTDNQPSDNNSTGDSTVTSTGGGATPCVLDCPNNITVTANATQSGNPGAFVTYSSAEGLGDCDEISTTVPSGNFFPVGTTPVGVSSSAGGGSCGFNVTVVTGGAPTISCPADQVVTAGAGATEATVNPGSPTTSPASGVSVSGVRSDDELLSAPYPVGATFITWTVTDGVGLTASCTQKITVNSSTCATDEELPTITAPPDVSLSTPAGTSGSCGVVIGESGLGSPDAADNCTFNVTRTGVPAGNFFPIGTTTVVYTVTDAAGNSATDSQTVTVTDGTSPIITAPDDASYVCLSDVPAGSASQATGADIVVAGELVPGPPSDNCGAPMVTVVDSHSGAGSTASPRIITRTYLASDVAGNTASDVQIITIIDPIAPTLSLNGASPQYVECHTSYPELGATADDNCGDFAATPSGTVNVNVPGTYTITYNASDWAGNAAAAITRTVIVQDTTAPTITLNGVTPVMWPPNHKYKSFAVTDFVSGVTDGCDTTLGVGSVVIEKVTSDETENGNGDGNTLNDIVIAANCKSVQLRAERDGGGNGRVYTITFLVRDPSGNTTRATAQVKVPHNNGGAAVDSGPHYTVTSSCP